MEIRVGQKVRIKADLTAETWAYGTRVTSSMERYRGKIATVTEIKKKDLDFTIYGLDIDKGEAGWTMGMFEVYGDTITFKRKKNMVIAVCGQVCEIAKCHPEDTFDYEEGIRIAVTRLLNDRKPKEAFSGKVFVISNAPTSNFKKNHIYTIYKGYLMPKKIGAKVFYSEQEVKDYFNSDGCLIAFVEEDTDYGK